MPGRAPNHESGAGGDPGILAAKAALRREVWAALKAARAARFPGADGRIPNFVGAEQAADRLRDGAEWQRSDTMKSNPDSPQLPVRQRALQDGKTVYMAVPRLASDRPFLRLDPARLTVPPRQAASIGGAGKHGCPVEFTDMQPVDLVITGCVAVSADGARLGKGAATATSSTPWPGRPGSSAPPRWWRPPCTTGRSSMTGVSPRAGTTFAST